MLDENNNKIGCISSSNKVSFKYKDKAIDEFYTIKNVNRLCKVYKIQFRFILNFILENLIIIISIFSFSFHL